MTSWIWTDSSTTNKWKDLTQSWSCGDTVYKYYITGSSTLDPEVIVAPYLDKKYKYICKDNVEITLTVREKIIIEGILGKSIEECTKEDIETARSLIKL